MSKRRASKRGNKLNFAKSQYTVIPHTVGGEKGQDDTWGILEASERKIWEAYLKTKNNNNNKLLRKIKQKIEQCDTSVWVCKHCGTSIGPLTPRPSSIASSSTEKKKKNIEKLNFQPLIDHLEVRNQLTWCGKRAQQESTVIVEGGEENNNNNVKNYSRGMKRPREEEREEEQLQRELSQLLRWQLYDHHHPSSKVHEGNKNEKGNNNATPSHHVWIVLDDPKNMLNVGSVLRAMGCLLPNSDTDDDEEEEEHCGGTIITTTSPHLSHRHHRNVLLCSGERLPRLLHSLQSKKKEPSLGQVSSRERSGAVEVTSPLSLSLPPIPTDTQGAAKVISCLHVPHLQLLFDAIHTIRQEAVEDLSSSSSAAVGITTVAVDLISHATPLPRYAHPPNLRRGESNITTPQDEKCLHRNSITLYLFGPEDGTLPQPYISQCDDAVMIPSHRSLNLANAVHVVLYDRLLGQWEGGADTSSSLYADGGLLDRNRNNHVTWGDKKKTTVDEEEK